jgi:hypothetical protein
MLNDVQTHNLYLTKMKSIIAMSKLHKDNYSDGLRTDIDIGLIVVDAYLRTCGKILFTNKIVNEVSEFTQ